MAAAQNLVNAVDGAHDPPSGGFDDTVSPHYSHPFTPDAILTLRCWYTANKHHPYPSQEDLESLCAVTGLEMLQVVNWFANAQCRCNNIGKPPTAPTDPELDLHGNMKVRRQNLHHQDHRPATMPRGNAATACEPQHVEGIDPPQRRTGSSLKNETR